MRKNRLILHQIHGCKISYGFGLIGLQPIPVEIPECVVDPPGGQKNITEVVPGSIACVDNLIVLSPVTGSHKLVEEHQNHDVPSGLDAIHSAIPIIRITAPG